MSKRLDVLIGENLHLALWSVMIVHNERYETQHQSSARHLSVGDIYAAPNTPVLAQGYIEDYRCKSSTSERNTAVRIGRLGTW